MTQAFREYAEQAEGLGRKLWLRGRKTPLGGRILSAKQIASLDPSERTLITCGWVSWAYCNYGCGELAGMPGKYLIVRK